MCQAQAHLTDSREGSGRTEALAKLSLVCAGFTSHLVEVPKCRGKAVHNLQQHLSGEKPAQTKLKHWVVSWWHFRAPKESWPPSGSSHSLPNLKKLCLLVWLCFAALKPVTKFKLNVEFICVGMKAQTLHCRHHLRHAALVANSEWKRHLLLEGTQQIFCL